MSEVPPPLAPIRVWDLPTRVFHWLLAAAVVGAVISAKIGGAAMVWHFRFGLLVMGLLLFRIVWGVIGGRWSRFGSFLYAPSTLLRYLRRQTRADEQLDVGHSPLGALSVFAMLGVLVLQVGTGLVADDEIANVGPLNRFVSSATGLAATGWHNQFGQGLVIGLVLLHVAAIAYHALARRAPLVPAMLSGDKPLPPSTPASDDGLGARLLALAVVGASASIVIWLSQLGH
jgi:cytochrome b